MSALWKWALAEELVEENLFSGFVFRNRLRANEQRAMWTREELQALYATPIWTGCQSGARRTAPGTEIVKDEKFWLPLIAVFSGLRQEEICQLHIEAIKKVDGLWVFDINARPPRQLKNRNAIRLTPVHSELVKLGLLEHVAVQKRAGQGMLFPNLKPGGADQRLGHNYSKWFTRYRRDVGICRQGLDFHSFRHTTTTLLQWAGVAVSIVDALTGHATPGETARYTKRFTIEQLIEATEKVDVGVDLTRLYAI